MFADQTIAGDSSSTRTYALTSLVNGSSVRQNAAAPVGLPEQLLISHQESSRSGFPLDRHLVRLNLAKLAGNGSTALTASVYVTIEVPRDSNITVAMIRDMRTQMVNFLTNANLDKILNGEP